MSHLDVIALKEKVNEARAKQRGHALAEMECIEEGQFHQREESRLEDEIICLEVELDQLKKTEAVKANDSAWSVRKMFGGKL